MNSELREKFWADIAQEQLAWGIWVSSDKNCRCGYSEKAALKKGIYRSVSGLAKNPSQIRPA